MTSFLASWTILYTPEPIKMQPNFPLKQPNTLPTVAPIIVPGPLELKIKN
jgi:hypothetical protein